MRALSGMRVLNPMGAIPVVSDDDHYADLGDWLDISVVEGLPENSFCDLKPSCNICQTVFKNSTTLNHHIKNRVCQKPIKAKTRKCPHCAKTFNTITGYQYHIDHRVCNNRESKIGNPKCPQCHKVFTTLNGLAYHQKKQVCTQILPGGSEDDQIMTCTNCPATFDNKASMLYHVTHNVCLHPTRKIKKRKTLKCPLCPKKFRAAISLKRHLRNQQCFEGARPGNPVVKLRKKGTSPRSHHTNARDVKNPSLTSPDWRNMKSAKCACLGKRPCRHCEGPLPISAKNAAKSSVVLEGWTTM